MKESSVDQSLIEWLEYQLAMKSLKLGQKITQWDFAIITATTISIHSKIQFICKKDIEFEF